MRVVIVGGGISGLSAAWYLHKQTPKASIVLLEQQPRLGGWIETRREKGFFFEMGPRTFLISRCEMLLQLIRELGLEQELVFSDPSAKARYLFYRGRLRSIPSLWPQLLRAGMQDLFAPRGSGKEESIYEFACRRFGTTAAELFFDAMSKGVFTGDIRKLSVDACFPFLHQWEAKYRSIAWGMWRQKKQSRGLFTLRGGMHRLIEELAKMPIEIHTGCKAQSIQADRVIANDRAWEADLIIAALPGQETAKLCKVPFSLQNASLFVVTMGYANADLLPKRGYGYLVPSIEREVLLGQIWDSSVFPIEGQTKVTSMVRSQSPEEDALDAMRRHLGIARVPDALLVKEAVIPQYEIGHRAKIVAFEEEIKVRFPKLRLAGNYFAGASVDACIRRAKQAIE